MNISAAKTTPAFRLALLLGTLFCTNLFGANWYVDASASGTADGLSRATAWRTFAAINQAGLAAGDTVWVYPGTYDERFTITKSGTSRTSRINYKGVGSPILRGIAGGTADYVAVIGFEITQLILGNTFPAIRLDGCDGWLIQDNNIHDTYGNGIVCGFQTNNNNNIVRHNMLTNIGSLSGGGGVDSGMIDFSGDSNLIEYNTYGRGLDRNRLYGAGNIIRNNLDTGTDELLFPLSNPFPYHIDFFQSYNSDRLLQKLLIERNFVKDNVSLTHNGHFFIVQDANNAGFNWFIIRGNIVSRMAEALYLFQNVTNVSIYNNTNSAIQNNATSIFQTAIGFNAPSGGSFFDFRNNTYVNSPNAFDSNGLIGLSNRPTNLTADYQHRFNAGIVLSASHNIANGGNVDPQFNTGTDDFTLKSTSPLRSAKGPITNASGGGSNSTSLRVVTSKRLVDGWGIVDPDTIRVGSGPYVKIASINYSTNIVTLASPITWNDGDGVLVKGSEDVGALPYAYTTLYTITNTSSAVVTGANTLSATIDNPDAVRKVEFLIDGVPVGEVYAAPYTVSYTSAGGTPVVTARAYSAWSSQVLIAEAVGSGGTATGGSGQGGSLITAPSNARVN